MKSNTTQFYISLPLFDPQNFMNMRSLNDKKKFCNLYNTKNMYKKCAENVGINAMHNKCKDASAISA